MSHSDAPAVAALTPWWVPLDLPAGQWWRCGVGPLSVYLQRGAGDWFLAWEQAEDSAGHYGVVSEAVSAVPEHLTVSRYAFARAPKGVCLKPLLLERPVVVKTNQPVHVPPGEKVTFYISSPVCVSVELQNPGMPLLEIPSVRLSDTWFGPSTQEGELCYAAKTQARNSLDELPQRPHRAVTPVLIHNRSLERLAIEKLSIPVPMLGLYARPDASLWTESVALEHSGPDRLAVLDIGDKPKDAQRLSVARGPAQANSLVRAFTRIFSD